MRTRLALSAGAELRAPRSDLLRGTKPLAQQRSSFAPPGQLTVGPAGDRYEQEADRVAEQVMSPRPDRALPFAAQEISTPRVQRMCSTCEHEDEKVRGKPQGASLAPSPHATDGIQASRGGGAPLQGSARAFFEPRFGRDFGDVRVHADAGAASLAEQLQARAFTVGRDVYFNRGQYDPSSGGGRRLLAHELTHVVQQQASGTRIQRDPAPSRTWPKSAHSAFHGIELYEFAEDHLPRTGGAMPQYRHDADPYVLYPQVVSIEAVPTEIVYYEAYNKKTKRTEFIVGADDVGRFVTARDNYYEIYAEKFHDMFPNGMRKYEKDSWRGQQQLMDGRIGDAVESLVKAQAEGLTDPHLLFQIAMAAGGGIASEADAADAVAGDVSADSGALKPSAPRGSSGGATPRAATPKAPSVAKPGLKPAFDDSGSPLAMDKAADPVPVEEEPVPESGVRPRTKPDAAPDPVAAAKPKPTTKLINKIAAQAGTAVARTETERKTKSDDCVGVPVCPHKGGPWGNDPAIDNVSGNLYPGCDFLVAGKNFDAVSKGRTLWEFKLGNFQDNPPFLQAVDSMRWSADAEDDAKIARTCNYNFMFVVPDDVALAAMRNLGVDKIAGLVSLGRKPKKK